MKATDILHRRRNILIELESIGNDRIVIRERADKYHGWHRVNEYEQREAKAVVRAIKVLWCDKHLNLDALLDSMIKFPYVDY